MFRGLTMRTYLPALAALSALALVSGCTPQEASPSAASSSEAAVELKLSTDSPLTYRLVLDITNDSSFPDGYGGMPKQLKLIHMLGFTPKAGGSYAMKAADTRLVTASDQVRGAFGDFKRALEAPTAVSFDAKGDNPGGGLALIGAKVQGPMESLVQMGYFRLGMGWFGYHLPDKPVRVGESWKVQIPFDKLYAQATGSTVKSVLGDPYFVTYALESVEAGMAKISAKGEGTFRVLMEPNRTIRYRAVVDGHAELDTSSGVIAKVSESDQVQSIEGGLGAVVLKQIYSIEAERQAAP